MPNALDKQTEVSLPTLTVLYTPILRSTFHLQSWGNWTCHYSQFFLCQPSLSAVYQLRKNFKHCYTRTRKRSKGLIGVSLLLIYCKSILVCGCWGEWGRQYRQDISNYKNGELSLLRGELDKIKSEVILAQEFPTDHVEKQGSVRKLQ